MKTSFKWLDFIICWYNLSGEFCCGIAGKPLERGLSTNCSLEKSDSRFTTFFRKTCFPSFQICLSWIWLILVRTKAFYGYGIYPVINSTKIESSQFSNFFIIETLENRHLHDVGYLYRPEVKLPICVCKIITNQKTLTNSRQSTD